MTKHSASTIKVPAKMPTVFISHGSPMMALEQSPSHDFLKELSADLPQPKAILVVSAHWETEEPMLTAHPTPELIYDFYGFPAPLYGLEYPVQGAPDVARAAQKMIQPLSGLDPERGLDHGAWVPLKLAYPEAAIPVLQMSVQPHLSAAAHYDTGRQLAALREQGVLIMASGNATHNLRAAMRGGGADGTQKALGFAAWLKDGLTIRDHDRVKNWERTAPDALWNHPTPEHFLPLFVALGAAGRDAEALRLHQSVDYDVLAMDAYRFS